MKKIVIGILAHVDAGKTTLSESMLYLSGKISKLGRVDNQDAYLDTFALEKARGITIFSKQAVFALQETQFTLLDTPGHVDFSAEMERTLQVLDYAVLVISGADGVQGHTRTLWRLLEQYQIPVFLFVNKMDQAGTQRDTLLFDLKQQLHDTCIAFEAAQTADFYEELAMCDDAMMEAYLQSNTIALALLQAAIRQRKVFPCFFGSALKMTGVEPFLQALAQFTTTPTYPNDFGAKIFKITRDEQGNRLTHMKMTGGTLRVKDVLQTSHGEEKVHQIRIYSGEKYTPVTEVAAGDICAVTGLSQTYPGEGLGAEAASSAPLLEPVLSYRMILLQDCSPLVLLPKLRQLEEEEPALHIAWNEPEIQVQIMGEVQLEILQSILQSRFDTAVTFDTGKIVYKETIADTVEGVGHFEPLRHYAEVHLLLAPGKPGSGVQFAASCSEDTLSKNWQQLILSHLQEKPFRGVLTGASITDMKITLAAGRAHQKHTEGGDFREATYRAVRQGLQEAESILLEPFYSFRLELPAQMVGRAMADVEKMCGTCEISQTNDTTAILVGNAPVATMQNYQKEVIAYTKGQGKLFCSLHGYRPCHNAAEVIASIGYDAESDLENPSGSVFCTHGSGFFVPWNQVKAHMHVESVLSATPSPAASHTPSTSAGHWISPEEVEKIISRTYYANQGKKSRWKRKPVSTHKETAVHPTTYFRPKPVPQKTYLLVDGYNIIHAWTALADLAADHMDAARTRLLDILSNYQAIRKQQVIVVFDAYRVKGHEEELVEYHNIHVVYTKEAQTADQYIEKFAHDHQTHYQITVATSDGLQQIIVRGAGCTLLSARELEYEVERVTQSLTQNYQAADRNPLLHTVSAETKQQLEALLHPAAEE